MCHVDVKGISKLTSYVIFLFQEIDRKSYLIRSYHLALPEANVSIHSSSPGISHAVIFIINQQMLSFSCDLCTIVAIGKNCLRMLLTSKLRCLMACILLPDSLLAFKKYRPYSCLMSKLSWTVHVHFVRLTEWSLFWWSRSWGNVSNSP